MMSSCRYVSNVGGSFKLNQPYLIEFTQKGDARGNLVVLEEINDVPFSIKRVFYIYGSDSEVTRGKHANRNTEFVLINVSGTSKVMVDNGTEKVIFNLNRPHIGIYLPRMIWKEMYDFSPDSVLLCIASTIYEPDEYIKDYVQFLSEIKGA